MSISLLKVISLNSDKARTAYEKQHKYGSTSRWTEHTGFVPTDGTGFVATDGGHVEHTREVDELCACALLSLLGVGAFAAEPKLEAALVVPIIDKLRASCVALGTTANWLVNFLVAATFLSLQDAVSRPGAFWLYGGSAILGGL